MDPITETYINMNSDNNDNSPSADNDNVDTSGIMEDSVFFITVWSLASFILICFPFISSRARRALWCARLKECRWNVEHIDQQEQGSTTTRGNTHSNYIKFLSASEEEQIQQIFLLEQMALFTTTLTKNDIIRQKKSPKNSHDDDTTTTTTAAVGFDRISIDIEMGDSSDDTTNNDENGTSEDDDPDDIEKYGDLGKHTTTSVGIGSTTMTTSISGSGSSSFEDPEPNHRTHNDSNSNSNNNDDDDDDDDESGVFSKHLALWVIPGIIQVVGIHSFSLDILPMVAVFLPPRPLKDFFEWRQKEEEEACKRREQEPILAVAAAVTGLIVPAH